MQHQLKPACSWQNTYNSVIGSICQFLYDNIILEIFQTGKFAIIIPSVSSLRTWVHKIRDAETAGLIRASSNFLEGSRTFWKFLEHIPKMTVTFLCIFKEEGETFYGDVTILCRICWRLYGKQGRNCMFLIRLNK